MKTLLLSHSILVTEDIVDNTYIPYIKSNRFPHLSKEQRAMQFAPFSVLEGLDEAIKEVERKAEEKFEIVYEKLDEEQS